MKFFLWLFERWLMLPVRYSFIDNGTRLCAAIATGSYSEANTNVLLQGRIRQFD